MMPRRHVTAPFYNQFYTPNSIVTYIHGPSICSNIINQYPFSLYLYPFNINICQYIIQWQGFLRRHSGFWLLSGSFVGASGKGEPEGMATGVDHPTGDEKEPEQAANCRNTSLLNESAGRDSNGREKRATGVPKQAVLGAVK